MKSTTIKKYLKKKLERMNPRVYWITRDANKEAAYCFYRTRQDALGGKAIGGGKIIWNYSVLETCSRETHRAGIRLEPGSGPVPVVLRKARLRGHISKIIKRLTK